MVGRTKKFQRNENLENLLGELNGLLEPVENGLLHRYKEPKHPLLFLVGCARSGTTIMMQWLADTGEFAYPTNFLSRFYAAPYVGAKIQRMLADPKYNFRDEFADFGAPMNFNSDLGKTQGVLSPNEFFYFWRRFFNYGEIQKLDESALSKVDNQTFCAELAAIEDALGKPLAMKGLIINWNIHFVHRLLPRAVFVYIKRDPVYNAQSLILAREKFFGSRNHWYSFKPPEYPALENQDPYKQVAGQVYFTNLAIEQGLSRIDGGNHLTVSYEEFCGNPGKTYEIIREKLALHGCKVTENYHGPRQFVSTNDMRIERENFELIRKSYEEFARA